MTPEPRRRLSLTKTQRLTAAGADLIVLCQTVTADGSLQDNEVVALRDWLGEHAQLDLPARKHLFAVLERILADGRITEEERRELYIAVETVLPLDLRELVRDRRKAREEGARRATRAAKEEGQAHARLERQRNSPCGSWNFMVAGVRYEGRPLLIARHVAVGDSVHLARDRANRFSPNAVEVRTLGGLPFGYVPEQDAIDLASYLDGDHGHVARVTKVLTGGRSPIPVVQAYVYPVDSTAPEAARQGDLPPRLTPPPSPAPPTIEMPRAAGCLSVFAALAVLLIVTALWPTEAHSQSSLANYARRVEGIADSAYLTSRAITPAVVLGATQDRSLAEIAAELERIGDSATVARRRVELLIGDFDVVTPPSAAGRLHAQLITALRLVAARLDSLAINARLCRSYYEIRGEMDALRCARYMTAGLGVATARQDYVESRSRAPAVGLKLRVLKPLDAAKPLQGDSTPAAR